MKKIFAIGLLISFAAFLLVDTSFAEYDSGEIIIQEGLKKYTEKGAKATIEAWIKGSALEGSKDALAQGNMLRQIEDYYGPYVDYDIIKINDLSKRSKTIYFVMNYEAGPLYCYFLVYKNTSNKWVLSQFRFHTEAMQILPPEIIFGVD